MKMHIDLDRLPKSHNVFTLDKPHRIVIDLPSSRISTLLSKELKARGTVRRIRYGKRNFDDLRIVLDINGQPGNVSSRVYQFKGTNRKRIVVDLGMAPITAEEKDEPVQSVIKALRKRTSRLKFQKSFINGSREKKVFSRCLSERQMNICL